MGVPAAARWVKAPALSLQWHGFEPQPGAVGQGSSVATPVAWVAAEVQIQSLALGTSICPGCSATKKIPFSSLFLSFSLSLYIVIWLWIYRYTHTIIQLTLGQQRA